MVDDKIAYSEVFEILSYMNRSAVMKIPLEILQYIKDNRNTEYISRISPNNIFNKENISKEARGILAWIDLEYLASSESKAEKLKIYEDNQKKYQYEISKKYSYDQLFKNDSENPSNNTVNTSKDTEALTVIKKPSVFDKFLNFIKKIFGIK